MAQRKFILFAPLLTVFLLVVLFAVMMMRDRNPAEIKTVMVGRAAPVLPLAGLWDPAATLDAMSFQQGRPILVNFFASWCVPCRAEHGALEKLAKDYGVPIIGIAYKNDPADARKFLQSLGDPYQQTYLDLSGRFAIEWGVSGVPETFLLDGKGVIRYRHWGPVVGDSLEVRLLPEIEALR